MGPITPEERGALMAASPVSGLYDRTVDRVSAYEVLAERAQNRQAAEAREREQAEREKAARAAPASPAPRRSSRQTPAEAAVNSFARTIANRLGSAIVRGILDGLSRRR
jgi:hypothetical protein